MFKDLMLTFKYLTIALILYTSGLKLSLAAEPEQNSDFRITQSQVPEIKESKLQAPPTARQSSGRPLTKSEEVLAVGAGVAVQIFMWYLFVNNPRDRVR